MPRGRGKKGGGGGGRWTRTHRSRKLEGSGDMLPRKIGEIWVPKMAGNALEILKMSRFVSVLSSGMGTFVKKIL